MANAKVFDFNKYFGVIQLNLSDYGNHVTPKDTCQHLSSSTFFFTIMAFSLFFPTVVNLVLPFLGIPFPLWSLHTHIHRSVFGVTNPATLTKRHMKRRNKEQATKGLSHGKGDFFFSLSLFFSSLLTGSGSVSGVTNLTGPANRKP